MTIAAWILAIAIVAAVSVPLLRPPAGRDAEVGPWRRAFDQIRRKRSTRIAIVTIVAMCIIGALAPALAPYGERQTLDIITMVSVPPSPQTLLGTDNLSRDVFSRILYGTRISLGVAMLAVLLSITVGTLYGAIAGFAGGRTDAVMMRLIDAALSVPRILMLIVVTALWNGVPLPVLIMLLGLTGWFGVSRIVRAEVMAMATREFVVSARSLGAGPVRVVLRHILPNVLSPVIVTATLGIGSVIILEAGLSYLGLGIQEPAASWGNIIHRGSQDVAATWWVALFPGLAIVATVMAFNTIGDGLRDALDPR
jgi:ABC-type dipeptide/oligopeptide/nickel transport system permease subunit